MANRVYLLNHSLDIPITAGEAGKGCLLEGGKYQVPILWMALFDVDDFISMDVPCTNDDDEEVVEKVPTLFVPTSKAKKTYAARRDWLVDVLGRESASGMTEWEAFLSTMLDDTTLQVDLTELWMMFENSADMELEIQDWLAGVSNQSQVGWVSLLSQANFDDPQIRPYGLRGHPWAAKLDWT